MHLAARYGGGNRETGICNTLLGTALISSREPERHGWEAAGIRAGIRRQGEQLFHPQRARIGLIGVGECEVRVLLRGKDLAVVFGVRTRPVDALNHPIGVQAALFIITGERICPFFIGILNSVVCYLERGITEMVDLERVIAAVFQERPSIWRNRQRGDPIFLVQCPVRRHLSAQVPVYIERYLRQFRVRSGKPAGRHVLPQLFSRNDIVRGKRVGECASVAQRVSGRAALRKGADAGKVGGKLPAFPFFGVRQIQHILGCGVTIGCIAVAEVFRFGRDAAIAILII